MLELGEGDVSGELGFGGVVEEDAAVENLGFAGGEVGVVEEGGWFGGGGGEEG